ncbi:hypothetical protein EON64_05350 [archaeon]|nr:MAG: hypothetical protein EON64_05350 [archaeon]
MKRDLSQSLLRAHSRGSLSRLMFEAEQCNGVTVSHDRSLAFRLVQCAVFLCRLITPFSYVYLLSQCVQPLDPARFPGGPVMYAVFLLWMLAEALFFPYYYYLFTQLNLPNEDLQHLARDAESRRKLVTQALQALVASGREGGEAPEAYVRRAVQGWFLDQPLVKVHFGNMAAWTAWAFFGKDVRHMDLQETRENNEIVRHIEACAQWKFAPGFNADIPSLRLNLDPVFATQRPFVFYACIFFVNRIAHLLLYLQGFRREDSCCSAAQNIYRRPAASASSSGSGKLPVVFVHGIGVGFAHYLYLLRQLPGDSDVFLVEWPYVTMQMATRGPTIDEAVQGVVRTLGMYGHQQAAFVAHSLGSSLVSWMLHDPLAARCVASTVLIDPIIFLLCDPTVASVFVYKDPSKTVDLLMHFFLSRELFISNALSRHFAWSHNILFVEDMLNNKPCCTAYRHLVVPTGSVDGTMTTAGSLPETAVHHRTHNKVEHTVSLSLCLLI